MRAHEVYIREEDAAIFMVKKKLNYCEDVAGGSRDINSKRKIQKRDR